MTTRIYTRVSTGFQATEGFSLAGQRKKCEAWAAYQDNGDVQVYEDAGISGKRDDRPGLTALLLDLKPGDTVVTYALSRLARGGAVQLLGIVRDIRAKDARVVSLTENIDTHTPTGRLMLTILAALAEMEIEQLLEKTDMGRTEAAQQGIYPHSPRSLPAGWTTDEEGRIIEDEAEAATVRLIFAQGPQPYEATAKMLNQTGVPTRRGGKWEVVQVRRTVLFEGYHTGQFVYRQSTHPGSPERHVLMPAPALVTREVWEAAQRDGRTNNRHKRPDVYPLTGHLRCTCGTRLSGQSSQPQREGWKGAVRYICHQRMRKSPICTSTGKLTRSWRPVEEIAQKAREALARYLTDPTDPARLAALYATSPLPDPHAEERVETERKLTALVDLYLERLIDKPSYEQRRATLLNHLTHLAPPVPQAPDEMPDLSDLAYAVRQSDNVQLAELLDVLDADLMMTEEGGVRVLNAQLSLV